MIFLGYKTVGHLSIINLQRWILIAIHFWKSCLKLSKHSRENLRNLSNLTVNTFNLFKFGSEDYVNGGQLTITFCSISTLSSAISIVLCFLLKFLTPFIKKYYNQKLTTVFCRIITGYPNSWRLNAFDRHFNITLFYF